MPRTVNDSTMCSDLYLTAISKIINLLLSYALNDLKYIRTTRKLLKLAI